MTIYLKQSTASQEILLGPFLSSTDGTTAKTGLTIANTDIKIWKTGGTTVGDKASGGATEISAGYYYAVLDATDTDTLGSLIITVNVATALMIRLECAVLAATVYDSWFSTGVLPVDVTTIHGSALTETAGQLAAGFTKFFDVAAPASTMELITAVTTCTTNTDMRGTDSAALATELAKVPKSDSNVSWNATALAAIQTECTDALNAYDPPTNTEMEARTLAAADYVVTTDTIAGVTLCTTCTTNTDMRGTDSAALASVCTETRLAELDAANLPANIDNILTDTGTTLDALIKRVLGLTQENFRISSPVYSVTGKMTSCTMTTYPTAADCTDDTNALATYTVTATYDVDDNLATYKVVKS